MSGPVQDATYTVVLYGDAAIGTGDQVNLAGLAVEDGFRTDLNGNGNVSSGLGGGDVNGYGLSDLILTNDSNNVAFVLFGNANLVYGALSMATLDGSDGFEIVDGANVEFFQLGEANGGFNGDGFDDMLFWEQGIGNGDSTNVTGAVLFGGVSPGALSSIDDLDDVGVGLWLESENNLQDRTGVGIGDINGDGLGDIFIADAPVQADGGGVVIFGRDDSGITIDFAVLDRVNGFRVVPPAGESLNVADFNNVAGAGDFSGDGIDNFVIGARALSTNSNSGQVYVIFGQRSAFGAELYADAFGFDEGFKVVNDEGGAFGITVSGAADGNGDGFNDIAIGGGVNAAGLEEQTILLGSDFAGGAQVGGDGADTFTGDGYTVDRFFSGQGDDILVISDNNFVRVDGGTGDDILRIPGDSGVTLVFTQPGDEGIHSIETIDLCGLSGNFLKIRPLDVAGLSETTNKLFVTGGAADGVALVGDSTFAGSGDAQSFIFDGVENVDGVTFDRFVAGARTNSI